MFFFRGYITVEGRDFMKFFFDTSALVKFFHVESGSEIVTQIMEHPASEIWMSELARLEFTSALYRRFRNKTLDEIRLHTALTFFDAIAISTVRFWCLRSLSAPIYA